MSDSEVTIPPQAPKAPKLEQWEMGAAQAFIKTDDAAWRWQGAWDEAKGRGDERQYVGKGTNGKGAEAEVKFTGTAVALLGSFGQDGGRAEVYLDGAKAGEINTWIPERTNDTTLWHAYDLKPGAHTLRIIPHADARSKGKRVALFGVITYVRSGKGMGAKE